MQGSSLKRTRDPISHCPPPHLQGRPRRVHHAGDGHHHRHPQHPRHLPLAPGCQATDFSHFKAQFYGSKPASVCWKGGHSFKLSKFTLSLFHRGGITSVNQTGSRLTGFHSKQPPGSVRKGSGGGSLKSRNCLNLRQGCPGPSTH